MDERQRTSAGYEYAEHVRAVLERAAEVQASEGHVVVVRTPLLLKPPIVVLMTIAFMSVVIWNMNNWNVPPAPRARETEEASLQVGLVVVGQMVEAFRVTNGRLPSSLSEIGLPESSFTYRLTDEGYEIFATGQGVTVRLDGAEDPAEVLRQLRLPSGSAAAMTRPATDRRGFTLAELAVAVMIVGILSGLAIPNVRSALLRADGAAIVSDSHTISVAAYEHLSETGRFPASGGPGTVPPELAPYLPDDFQFSHKGSNYYWISVSFPSPANPWQTRNLGILIIDSSNQTDVGAAMQSFDGPDSVWTPILFYFLYRG